MPYHGAMSNEASNHNLAAIAAQAIAAAGGSAALSRATGIPLTTINDWKAGRIPASRMTLIAKHTGISVEALRPDLFAQPGGSA